ncbi:MAG: TetR/AcrR family transcriptional regulator [Candidatus Limnocylindria bacterium]
MGVRERRERERQQRKAAILEATRDIAAREGWQAATIRRVADALELSTPTIYEHFDSKDAILGELVQNGYRRCLATLRSARARTEDPQLALVGMGQAYWDFAWDSPELFHVMHGLGGVPFSQAGLPPEAQAAHAEVQGAMLAAAGGGQRAHATADHHAILFWATLHGLITLAMVGRVPGGTARAAELVEPAVRATLPTWAG